MYISFVIITFMAFAANTGMSYPNGELLKCQDPDINEIIELNCWGYAECLDGIVVVRLCKDVEVFKRATMTCVPKVSNPTVCSVNNCTGIADGRYTDFNSDCASFYTCQGGTFRGYIYCPADLVFSNVSGVCDNRNNVAPPCGTKYETVLG